MEEWMIKIRLKTVDTVKRETLLDHFEEILKNPTFGKYSFSVKKAPRPPEPDHTNYYRKG